MKTLTQLVTKSAITGGTLSNSHYGILSLIKRHLLTLSRNNDA